MTNHVTNEIFTKAIHFKNVFNPPSGLLCWSEEAALGIVRNDRIRDFLANMFLPIEAAGEVVTIIVISPYVHYVIRSCNNNRDGIPFYEGTRKEFLTSGLVYGLWTADMFLAKECDGIYLYPSGCNTEIESAFPSLKEKWKKKEG